MDNLIKKEQLNGTQKVVVGEKYNDLVLRTLGKVYIQTGSKFTLLTEYIDKLTTNKDTKILILSSEEELNNQDYPGDGYFIFITSNKNLYISFKNTYVPLIIAGTSSLDWETLTEKFMLKSGDHVNNYLEVRGELTADSAKFNKPINIISEEAPLKIVSKDLVKNLNAEYLQGYGPKDIPIKTRDEIISGLWKFNNITEFNDSVKYNGKLVSSTGFAPGFTGHGWMLDTQTGTLTIDNLIVRKIMHVYELVVNKISATNGSLWVSDSSKIKSVEIIDRSPLLDDEGNQVLDDVGNQVYISHPLYGLEEDEAFDKITEYLEYNKELDSNVSINVYDKYFKGSFYHVILEEDYIPFRLNDLIRCQRFDGVNINYYDAIVTKTLKSNEIIIRLSTLQTDTYDEIKNENGELILINKVQNCFETDEDGNIVQYVDVVSPDTIFNPANYPPDFDFSSLNLVYNEIYTNTFEHTLDLPKSGDSLVRIGNTVNKDRQGSIYLSSNDIIGPHIDILDDVLVPNFNKTIVVKNNNKLIYKKPLKVRLGNLNGIVDPDFIKQPSGWGLYADNVYLKGKFMQVNSDGLSIPIPVYRGQWNSIINYYIDDQVTHAGEIYICIKDNINNEPSNESIYWKVVVSKGEQGPAGIGASPLFYGEWSELVRYPVSLGITSIVYLTSGSNKQYFKTKVIDGFGGNSYIQGIRPLTNDNTTLQEPWEEFGGDFQSIATGLLLAENARINFLRGNQLLLMNSNNDVVGGLSGFDTNSTDTRIWVGASDSADAPFKVLEDGSLIASKARITGIIDALEGGNIGRFKIVGNYLQLNDITEGTDIRIGTSVLPGSSGWKSEIYIKDTTPALHKAIIAINSSPADTSTISKGDIRSHNNAIEIEQGSVRVAAGALMDVPGLLLAGNLTETLEITYAYGKRGRGDFHPETTFKASKDGDNLYRITHNLGHTNYTISVTPWRPWYEWNKIHVVILDLQADYFQVAFIDSGTSNTWNPSGMCFQVFGENIDSIR